MGGYDKKDQHMIRKRQLENSINASLAQVLSYRLREGFSIKRVNLKPSLFLLLCALMKELIYCNLPRRKQNRIAIAITLAARH